MLVSVVSAHVLHFWGEAGGERGIGPCLGAGCEGCASEIEVAMTLGTDLNTFKNLIPEFVDDLVRELSVDASQVGGYWGWPGLTRK